MLIHLPSKCTESKWVRTSQKYNYSVWSLCCECDLGIQSVLWKQSFSNVTSHPWFCAYTFVDIILQFCGQDAFKAVFLTAQSRFPLSTIMTVSWGSWRPSIFWRSSSKRRFHCASSVTTFGFLKHEKRAFSGNACPQYNFSKSISTIQQSFTRSHSIVYCPGKIPMWKFLSCPVRQLF